MTARIMIGFMMILLNTVMETRDIVLQSAAGISDSVTYFAKKALNALVLLARLHFMRVFSRLLVIVVLCFAIGLHWCALQSIAWTTMVIEYSKDAPFAEALAKAFDGQHPCSLCHAVQTGKKSEQKNNARVVTRIDFYCAASANPRIHEFLPFDYPADVTSPIGRTNSPLTPPPRPAA